MALNLMEKPKTLEEAILINDVLKQRVLMMEENCRHFDNQLKTISVMHGTCADKLMEPSYLNNEERHLLKKKLFGMLFSCWEVEFDELNEKNRKLFTERQ